MSIFQPPDDPAYLAWLDANPNGYVINTERGGRQYVMHHRATCNYMRRFPPFMGRPTSRSARHRSTNLRSSSRPGFCGTGPGGMYHGPFE